MKDKKLVLLIFLTILAVISVIYGITYSPKKGGQAVVTPAAPRQENAVAGKTADTASPRRAKRSKHTEWGRNPFAPKTLSVKTGFALSGIMWDEKSPMAIIGSDVVGVGGKVGGYTVMEIKKDSVILNNGTDNLELKLTQ